MSPTGGVQWLCSPRQVATPSQTPVRYRTQTSASGLSARLLPSSSTPSSRSPPPSPTSWPSLIPNVLGNRCSRRPARSAQSSRHALEPSRYACATNRGFPLTTHQSFMLGVLSGRRKLISIQEKSEIRFLPPRRPPPVPSVCTRPH